MKNLDSVKELCSSYKENNYQYLFYSLIRFLKPNVCVELGVLEGFSLFSMGFALQANGKGKIVGYDLFEDYQYRHAKYKDVIEKIKEFKLGDYVKVFKADVRLIAKEQVDLLHVDLSNDGRVYSDVFRRWSDIVSKIIILEGGSFERDEIKWMTEYNKVPIVDTLTLMKDEYHKDWNFITFEPFPSITIAMRK